jgi:hypothetical protein
MLAGDTSLIMTAKATQPSRLEDIPLTFANFTWLKRR